MTDKPRKWEPARRQSRRVLSSLGLRSSPGQQPPNPEDRTTPPHTAAAGIMAALNYASESRPVTIPELESMSASEVISPSASASSSAAVSESLVTTAAAPAVVAVAAPSTGLSISSAGSSSSAPIATSLLTLPFFTSSVSFASTASFASVGSTERGGSVVSSRAIARASTPASASGSTSAAKFTFGSSTSTSTSTSSMSNSDVFSSLPAVSVPVRVRARLPTTSTSTSTSHTTTPIPTPPTTIATYPIPSTATPTSTASAATSASITTPLQPINPFYRPRQRSLSFYDASTSEDAALPQNRHLVQSQIHGGIGSSRYVAAIRDAALGVSEEEESDSESEGESESERSEESTTRRRFLVRGGQREGSVFGRDPFFFATGRNAATAPATGAAVVGFSSSVLDLASGSAAVAGSSVSASASAPSQRQMKTSASVQKSTSYPFRSEDLDAAYRRASFGSGFNSSIESHMHSYVSGGESPLKGILKRRYAAPSKSPSAREKRVSFMEGAGAGEDEGDVFGDDNEGLPREVVEFVGKLVEDEDVGEGEVGGEVHDEVAATTVVDEVGAESDTVSGTMKEGGADDVPGEKFTDYLS